MTNYLLKKCGPSDLLEPCPSTQFLKGCNIAACWTVATVTFNKDPGAISFSCRGCAAPGFAISYFSTSLADGSDRNVMVTCLDVPITICLNTFTTAMYLEQGGWRIILDDSQHRVHAYALSTNHSNHVLVGACPFPAYRLRRTSPGDPSICMPNSEIGLPMSFGDPGGNSRFEQGICEPAPDPPYTPCAMSWHVSSGGIRYSGCPAETDPGYPYPNRGDVLGVGGESPSPPDGSPCPA